MLRKGSVARNEAFSLMLPLVFTEFPALLDFGDVMANKTDLILNPQSLHSSGDHS